MQDSGFARNIDRYVGRLLCRLISWVRKILRWRKHSPAPPRTILMIELFEMGAAVMLLPSIRWLKSRCPQAEIHVLTTRSCASIWSALDALDAGRIHVVESSSALAFLRSIVKSLLRLRSIKFDLIIDFELFMRVSAVISGLLKAGRRAGFYKYDFEGLERGDFYEAKCAFNQNSHIARNYLSLTKTALESRSDTPNLKEAIPASEIAVSPTFRRRSADDSRHLLDGALHPQPPYIVICPDVGKTLVVRNYPKESFAEVIRRLLDLLPSHRVAIIGTAASKSVSEAILQQVPQRDRCLDLCGKTDFSGLMEVIAQADLLITNDNGPAHFATLTGTKTLALFSTDSPFVYGPLGDAVIAYTYYQCSPCISAYNHKRSRCDDNRCLQALPPSQVVRFARLILGGEACYRTINNETPYILP